MPFSLAVSPSPLPVNTGFRVHLRITGPDVNPGDTFLLMPTGRPPVVLDHDTVSVPAGATDPTDLEFESVLGFTAPGTYELCVVNILDVGVVLDRVSVTVANPAPAPGPGPTAAPAGGTTVTIHHVFSAGASPAAPARPTPPGGTPPPESGNDKALRRAGNVWAWIFPSVTVVLGLTLIVSIIAAVVWAMSLLASNSPVNPPASPTSVTAPTSASATGPAATINPVCTTNCQTGNVTIGGAPSTP